MSITSTINKVTYNCNGVQTVFPFAFKIFEVSDLIVTLTAADGTETILLLTTNYTVSAINDDFSGGGNVTTLTAYGSGNKITIAREMPLTQETDYTENSAFEAESHEAALDKLTMISQQLNERIGRNLSVPITDAEPGLLPNAATRASKFLAFDPSGDPMAAAGVASVPATAWAATLLDDATVEEAQVTMGMPGKRSVTMGSAVAAGDKIAVKQDGSLWKIVAGSSVQVHGTNGAGIDRCIRLSDTLVVFLYGDGTATTTYVRAGTVAADGTITLGSAATVIVQSPTGTRIGISRLSATAFIVAYRKNSDTYGYAMVGTISGTTISLGAESQFKALATTGVKAIGLSDTAAVIVYTETATSYVRVKSCAISGNTISSWGAEVNPFSSAKAVNDEGNIAGWTIDSTHFGVAAYVTSSAYHETCSGSISGTTITMATSQQFFGNGGSLYWDTANDSLGNVGVVCAIAQDAESTTNSNFYSLWVSLHCYDSGHAYMRPTYPVSLGKEGFNQAARAVAFVNANWLAIAWGRNRYNREDLYIKFVRIQNPGTSMAHISNPWETGWTKVTDDFVWGGTTVEGVGLCRLDGDRVVVMWEITGGTGNEVLAKVLSLPNFAGIAQAAGTTIEIRYLGEDSNQAGLTTGQRYYLGVDGALITDPVTPEAYVGKAIAATKILVGCP